MTSDVEKDELAPAAARLERDSRFVAWALANYRDQFRLTSWALAEELVCDVAALTTLALCRMPRVSESPQRFQADVQAVAAYAGCDWRKLLVVIRAVTTLSSMRLAAVPETAMLLQAARKNRRSRSPKKPRGK